jgi:hypothetical protein
VRANATSERENGMTASENNSKSMPINFTVNLIIAKVSWKSKGLPIISCDARSKSAKP